MSKKRTRYTEEQINFLREIANGRKPAVVTEMFNEKFGTQKSPENIKNTMAYYGIRTNVPPGTRFKKGENGTRTYPIGTESYLNHRENNYLYVKIAQPDVWQLKHRFLYEKHIGPIPKGYRVIFLDGNRTNFDLANLHAVSGDVYMSAISRGLLYDNAEATKSGLLLAEMLMNVNKRSKEKVNETTNLSE